MMPRTGGNLVQQLPHLFRDKRHDGVQQSQQHVERMGRAALAVRSSFFVLQSAFAIST